MSNPLAPLSRMTAGLNRGINFCLPLRVRESIFYAHSFDRFAYLWLHKLGLMGREEMKMFQGWIHSGMTVLDVGANLGVYTALFSKLVGPSGRVIAIEPARRNERSLRRSVEKNRLENVEIHRCALAEHEGKSHLRIAPLNSGNNALSATADGASTEEVQVRTLDSVVAGRKVDFVKIDVQGWEAAVLKGAAATLSHCRPVRLVAEVWPQGLRNAGSSGEEIYRLLDSFGLSVQSPPGWTGRRFVEGSGYLGGYDIMAFAPANRERL